MPQQTVYIRNGDVEKWKALKNKAAFISKHLNQESFGKIIDTEWDPDTPPTVAEAPKIIKSPLDAQKAVNEGVAQMKKNYGVAVLPKLCKIHGTPLDGRGKCLQKGCKYA